MKLSSRATFLVLAAAIAAGGAACADILGIQAGRLEPDASTDDGSVEAQVDGGGTESAPPEAASDAPVDAPVDAPTGCGARAVDDATGIFVTLYGVDGASCGTRASPCRTVQQGIQQATLLQRSTVYIARGTYTEAVTLGSGITLEGGWDTVASTWVPICDTNELSAVAIQMPSSANVAVTVSPGATGAGLRILSVLGKAGAQSGESVYGVFAQGGDVTLDSVIVTMGDAGQGAQGTDGVAGVAGDGGCAAGAGVDGGSAGNAPPTTPGTFTASGWQPSGGLTGSSDGGTGDNGPCTLTPSCITECGSCAATCPKPTSGCGGGPGQGGQGGLGGGSSIALFAWNTKVTVIGGSLSAGNGGNGGNGGAGGPGGSGGPGQATQATCISYCGDAGCATVGDTTLANASAGGVGGAGGHGGGGAGGDSYAIYAGGDAGTLTMQSSPALSHGQPGQGGVVNGASGQAGDKGP